MDTAPIGELTASSSVLLPHKKAGGILLLMGSIVIALSLEGCSPEIKSDALPASGLIESPVHLRASSDWVSFRAKRLAEMKADLFLYNAHKFLSLACFISERARDSNLDEQRAKILTMHKDAAVKWERKSNDTLRICYEAKMDDHFIRYHDLLNLKGSTIVYLTSGYELPEKLDYDAELEGILDSYR